MTTAVLGTGSWGTALAVHLARLGETVVLWGREEDEPDLLQARRENVRYLPGVLLPENCHVTSDLARLAAADMVAGVVPSAATAEVARRVRSHLAPGAVWVSATKGLEPGTRLRMTEVVERVLGPSHPACALTGPSFAKEVAQGQPTAVVAACTDIEVARRVQRRFAGPWFRVYASSDACGAEMGGALKNIIAIGAGLCSGLGLGHDANAALITRGLREITTLAVAMGARPETMTGLAGLGDLVLTCTGGLSRNRRLGEMLATGTSLDDARAEIGEVSEGVETTARALEEATVRGVELPIAQAVHDVLHGVTTPREAVANLMQRALRDEMP